MAFLTEKEIPDIPLLDFQPDGDPTKSGILLDMTGAFPTSDGFQAMPSAVQFTNAAPSVQITGAALAYFSTGQAVIYIATQQHIYAANIPSVYPIVTPIGGFMEVDGGQTYTAVSPWQFFQFGDDVIAVASGVAPQVASGAGIFAALAGSPPNGATNGVAAGGTAFLFKGQQWFNAATGTDNSWTPNIQTQAGSGTLYDFPGPITGCATLYRNVIIFKQNAIWLGQFQGQSTAPWSFQLISDFTGTWGQGCICVLPNAVAFVGTDDFYLTTGYTPQAIPNNLKKWFFANAPVAYRQLITSRFDPENSVIYWYFVSSNNPAPGFAPFIGASGTGLPPAYPDRFVSYNTRSQRWGTGYVSNLIAPIALTVPTLPITSTQFLLRNVTIFRNNIPDLTQTFVDQLSGTPGSMSLTTGWMGMARHLTEIFRVRIKYNVTPPFIPPQPPNFPTLIPFHSYTLGDPGGLVVQGDAGVLSADAWFNVRQYDRYHQFQLATQGQVEVQGFAYEGRIGGLV